MILTITPSLSQYVIDSGAEESKVKLLLIPVDTGMFRPAPDSGELRQKWGFSPDNQIIVFIGTLFEFSGMDVLIPQFARLLKELPETRLLIVGDGPQRPKLERIIAGQGLNQKVVITGFQPYAMMPRFLNMATVCVNPFLITPATRDIFPGKMVQYLACGKAVIASALPGLTAVISGEDQGVIYTGPDNMAEALIELLRSPQKRQKLGHNGLDYVVSTHSYDKIAHQLEERLGDAVREKRLLQLGV